MRQLGSFLSGIDLLIAMILWGTAQAGAFLPRMPRYRVTRLDPAVGVIQASQPHFWIYL
jgi:hypothetical protein